MGSDMHMAAESFRPRPDIVIWKDSETIEVSRDHFMNGYKPFYTGPVTEEVKTLLRGLGILIPDKPLPAMRSEEELAVELHELLCRWNHADGCGWHYEMQRGRHLWDGSAHARYLAKAKAVLAALPELLNDDINDVVKAIRRS